MRTLRNVFGELKRSLEKPKNKWSLDKLIRHNNKTYEKIMGYKYDWDNPCLFTEKIQWYKLNYQNDSLSEIVDKCLFKDYIKRKLGNGYTIPLYGVWDSIESFKREWKTLPSEFVLKSTVQSDGKFIRIIHNKKEVDSNALFKEVATWFNPKNTLINSHCSAYHNLSPRILAEKYMAQADNQLFDYKFFCFSGIPYFVYVAKDHFPGQLSHISFYDLDWNRCDVQYGEHPQCVAEKPKHFDEMLEISKKLSNDFPFVRVDFFDTNEKLYVAELTFYPGGGLVPYYPESFNKELGDLFELPVEKNKYESA